MVGCLGEMVRNPLEVAYPLDCRVSAVSALDPLPFTAGGGVSQPHSATESQRRSSCSTRRVQAV